MNVLAARNVGRLIWDVFRTTVTSTNNVGCVQTLRQLRQSAPVPKVLSGARRAISGYWCIGHSWLGPLDRCWANHSGAERRRHWRWGRRTHCFGGHACWATLLPSAANVIFTQQSSAGIWTEHWRECSRRRLIQRYLIICTV
jgi:hypothetical protein